MNGDSRSREIALGLLGLLGISVVVVIVAGAAIAGGAIGGGLLAVRIFVSPEQREATVNLAEAFWFSAGAVAGGVASLLLVIGAGSLLSAYVHSSDDETMGDGRDWKT